MADPFNDDTDYDFSNLPGGYKQPLLALSKEEANSQTNAMELLRQSMQRSAEVSPSQGLAASLLAAVPTLGGYLIGNSVGTPDIGPAGSMKFGSFDEYKKMMGGTGGFAGGLEGADIGAKSSGGYLKGLDEQQAARADVLQKQASIEANNAARLQNDKSQLMQRGLAQADEERMLPLKERSQIRIDQAREAARQQNRGAGDASLSDPLVQSFLAKKQMGIEPSLEETMAAAKSKAALTLATKMDSTDAYRDANNLTQDRFNTQQSYAEAPDTVAISPSGNDPKMNKDRAKIIDGRNVAKSAVEDLANSYDKTKGQWIGLDRAKEQALASLIYSSARGIAGTGAALTKSEEPLVSALSAPQMDINGFTDWLHTYLTKGGNPADVTRTVGSVLDKAFNEKLKATGRQFKEYAQPAGGVSPSMDKGGGTPAPTGVTPPPAGGTPKRIKGESVAEYKARVGF